ncbi:MAG: hypothetical protein PHW11_08830 [Anaerolineaceae bacterium]|nr:hypothetical protein [Anaerolineaceae bacterium]MDD4043641.1 hypothetical protein [Anaerolineaceae bacterium]MDD4577586.1 hypothetical protein [Anaerolineaceae bacterium]
MAKNDESGNSFSDAEKEAMKERSKEIKRASKGKTDGEEALMEKINEMAGEDKNIASSLHELIKQNFPQLGFRTWYGFPAYTKDGKVITFFQASGRFDERYSTLGFSADAKLDDGSFWPTSYALLEWNDNIAAEIKRLIKKAVG